jgi:hypothetical protein
MRTLVIVILVAIGSAAHAQGIVIPPVEFDVGATSTQIDRPPAVEMLVGVSWSSLAWVDTRVDVGVGYVHASRDVLESVAARTRSSATDTIALDGGYLSLGYAIHDDGPIRVWLSGRVELDAAAQRVVTGEAARLAIELHQWDAFASSTPCGAVVRSGSLAAGAFAELSHRDLPAELGRDALTVGLYVRMPFVAAAGGGGNQ